MSLTIPELTPVRSTNLAAVGYDAVGSVLYVRFRNGSVYHFAGVPTATYTGLMSAASKGRYFNRNIRDRYSGGRIR